MNTELLDRAAQLFPNCDTLPEICMFTRMAVNGTSDSAETPEEILEVKCFLKDVIAAWCPRPSSSPQHAFDEAVRQLVIATIAEIEFYS